LIVRFQHAIFVPKGMTMSAIADAKTFGAMVRAERKSQKLTQEQLAGLAGVGVRFLRELEAGKESCQLGRALQVAQTLGLIVSVNSRREL
jgi:y4mF family transcriptional regulator